MKYLYISADYNDADYVTTFCEIRESTIPLIKKVAAAITAVGKHNSNWQMEGYNNNRDSDPYKLYEGVLTVDEIDSFNTWVPYAPEAAGGIHTIYGIKIFEITNEETLL